MKKIKFILIIIIISIFEMNASDSDEYDYIYKINYNDKINILEIEITYQANFNTESNSFIKIPEEFFSSGIILKVKEINLIIDQDIQKLDYKFKNKEIIIKNSNNKNNKGLINVKFNLLIIQKKPYLLWNHLFFPIIFFNKNDIIKDQSNITTYNIEITLPKKWILLSPIEKNIIQENDKNKYFIILKTNELPMLLAAKNINKIYKHNEYSNDYLFYGKKNLSKIFNSYSKNEKNLDKIIEIKSYLEELFNSNFSDKEFRCLITSSLNISFNIDDVLIINKFQLNNLTNDKNATYLYNFIHNMAFILLSQKIDYLESDEDYWLIEGLSHYSAINYIKNNLNFNLDTINSNKFIKFLMGSKNSTYSKTKNIFRDYVRYKTIKSISQNNKTKVQKYTNKARVINDHYSILVLLNLKNLCGQNKFDVFIKSVINENTFLKTNIFLDNIKSKFGINEYEIMNKLIFEYPIIDFKIKKIKNDYFIIKKGEAILPLEIEIIDKEKNKKRIIIVMNQANMNLNLDKNIQNIILDPDGLIEEINEYNNSLYPQTQFSLITPLTTPDKYVISTNAVLCNYDDVMLEGLTVSGGWNLKSFNSNSITKPILLWGIDCGYGYDSLGKFNSPHNGFLNIFFETSINPMSIWSPNFYAHFFYLSGESLSFKFGFQSFLPPVINTEHDKIFFNHSWDAGFDFKVKYYPYGTIDFNLNCGYKIYFKINFFTIEGIISLNFDFDKIAPKGLDIGGLINTKLNFDFFETSLKTGILKNLTRYDFYEYTRPKFTRLSLVTNTIGYYEMISNNLVYAKNLIIKELPYPVMDFFFLSYYFTFKIIFNKEPFLYPNASLGIGAFLDYIIIVPFDIDKPRALLAGGMLKLDILNKTSIILKVAALPVIISENNQAIKFTNLLSLVFFEIKSYF